MTALIPADRNRLFRAAAALVGVAVVLGGCNTDRALIASVPDDYRLRHPIAVQEANQSVVIFVGQARGGLSASQRADVVGLAQTWLREGTGAIRADLPGAPNLRVDHGLLAAAKRRALCDGDELLGLDRQQRQSDRTNAIDLQPRREHLGRAGREEISGTANRAQQCGELVGNG